MSVSNGISPGSPSVPPSVPADASMSSTSSGQTPSQDSIRTRKQLRQSFIDGTLTPKRQHALKTDRQLRKGMLGGNEPNDSMDDMRRATSVSNSGVPRAETPSNKPQELMRTSGLASANSNGPASPADESQPAKKKFTMKRTGQPERPNPAGVLNGHTTSTSISRAPFKPSTPVNSNTPVVSPDSQIIKDTVSIGSTQTGGIQLPRKSKSEETSAKPPSMAPANQAGLSKPASVSSGSGEGLNGKLRGERLYSQSIACNPNEETALPNGSGPIEKQLGKTNTPELTESTLSDNKESEVNSKLSTVPTSASTQKQSSGFLSYAAGLLKDGFSRATPSKSKPENYQPSPKSASIHQSIETNPAETASLRARSSRPNYNLKELTRGKRGSIDSVMSEPKRQRVSSLYNSIEPTKQEPISYQRLPRSGGSSVSGNYETDEEDRSTATPFPHRLTAENGRPYNKWRLENGCEISTKGALLPTDYQPMSASDHPWVCPLRSCRYMFDSISGLGHHFVRLHRRQDLNDNGDGTLSIEQYREKGGTTIVSQRAISLSDDPMVAPTIYASTKAAKLPTSTIKAPVNSSTSISGSFVDRDVEMSDDTTELSEASMSLWKKIHPRLKDTPFSPIPRSGYVPQLLACPEVRPLKVNPQANQFFVSRVQDISAMIMQITGKEAPQPCQRCQDGKGPFLGCIVLPDSAPESVKIKSCANCFYKGSQTYCNVSKSVISRNGVPGRPPGSSSKKTTQAPTLVEAVASSPPGRITRANPSGLESNVQSNPSIARQPRQTHHSVLGDTKVAGKDDNPMEMRVSEWEIAPGRIRDESGEVVENIAFSTTYLAHGEEVSVAPDVAFNILVIKAGTRHRWNPTPHKRRVCSVASGKIRVMMLGKDFELGPNGMFIIVPNAKCVVQNLVYGDATLHVSTMPHAFAASE